MRELQVIVVYRDSDESKAKIFEHREKEFDDGIDNLELFDLVVDEVKKMFCGEVRTS